ncbi:MAG: glycosyltransferase [Rhizobiaceae bacterium]|nr:glycosyltransferase [Rhizobiaceae bacterium]
MRARRICFATFELAPFTGGGIGTWLANTLIAYRDRSTRLEVLFCAQNLPDPAEFKRLYPGVVLHTISLDTPPDELLEGRTLRRKDMISVAQWRSYLLMCALERMEKETGHFDVVEFVDWCGAAYFSANAKKLGRSFQKTQLAVRLHATEGVLRDFETRGWSTDNLIVADLERQALLDADVKVAHLPPIADAFQSHFGFSEAWRAGFRIDAPPVAVQQRATRSHRVTKDTPLVFTSKFQSIKRPEIFARAASRLLTERPTYGGTVRFLAFDVDSRLRHRCEAAFPAQHQDRVTFGGPSEKGAREAIIKDSVAVFPGAFETFCFAAYEASLVGALVVLNEQNPAFGDDTPWIDGVNCIKFDGTSSGLFEALDRIFSTPACTEGLVPVQAEPTDRPYWEMVPLPSRHGKKVAKSPSLAIVVPHRYEGGLLHGTVDSILSDGSRFEKLVVASQADGEPAADLVLDALETLSHEAEDRVTLVRRRGEMGIGALLTEGLAQASADVIAIIPAGFEVLPDFLETAVATLGAQPEHDAILPMIRVVPEHDVFRSGEPWLPLGASIHYGTFVNRMSAGCVVARRSLFEEFPPSEILTAEWMWDILLRAAFAGRRFLITDEPAVQAIVRVLFDHYPHEEEQRRETFEHVRRRHAIQGSASRLPMSFLGDGELLAARGPLHENAHAEIASLRDQVEHGHAWRERALAAEDQLKILTEATTVQLALRTARAVETTTPWLRKPLRAALRRARSKPRRR